MRGKEKKTAYQHFLLFPCYSPIHVHVHVSDHTLNTVCPYFKMFKWYEWYEWPENQYRCFK